MFRIVVYLYIQKIKFLGVDFREIGNTFKKNYNYRPHHSPADVSLTIGGKGL